MNPAPEQPLSLQALQCLSQIRRVRDKDGKARIGRETMAKRLNKSPRQVSRYLVELQAHGVIVIARDPYRVRVNEYDIAGSARPASHPFSQGQVVTPVASEVVTKVSHIETHQDLKTTPPRSLERPAAGPQAEGVSKKELPDAFAARLLGQGIYHPADIELVRRELHVRTSLNYPDAYAFKRLEVLTSKRLEQENRRKSSEKLIAATELAVDQERETRASTPCAHAVRMDVWCRQCAEGPIWQQFLRKEFFPSGAMTPVGADEQKKSGFGVSPGQLENDLSGASERARKAQQEAPDPSATPDFPKGELPGASVTRDALHIAEQSSPEEAPERARKALQEAPDPSATQINFGKKSDLKDATPNGQIAETSVPTRVVTLQAGGRMTRIAGHFARRRTHPIPGSAEGDLEAKRVADEPDPDGTSPSSLDDG